jgi:hypothetical protein
MDTSNPVMTSERITLRDFMNDNILLKRQDYKELDRLTKEGMRCPPEFIPGVEEVEVDEGRLKEMESSGLLVVDKGRLEVPLTVARECVLVGRHHPTGMNQAGANVCVSRTFPQRKRILRMMRALLAYNPQAAREIEKVTYTGGTKNGFIKRLAKWSCRKPRNMKEVLKEHGFSGPDILKKCLPVDINLLKDWHQPLNDLLQDIKITKTSGAGPPFFRPKYRCMDEVMTVMRELVAAISDDTIDNYMKDNPELVMSECKNKLDRYEVEKVAEKTRPYWSFSAPVMFLISILCQDFCKALKIFHEKGSNAYGFSWAHGGGQRMWNWMTETKEGEKKFTVYGDDTKLVWRKEGKLYEVNPDFEQMDGSVDKDTVQLTIDWVCAAFTKKWGRSDFFEYICLMWEYLAIGSEFFVEGEATYSSNTGLLTGIVGTTLFDTVKSVLAYELYVHTRVDPMDAKASKKFFQDMGLVVKEGTWNPVRVNEEVEEGALCSEEKFLGAQLMVIRGKEKLEAVPYVSEDDLLKLIGNMRQQEVVSHSILNRRLFDTARGYMITGAYHHPRIWNSMCKLIEETPSEIIVQRVQADEGRGEKPELETFTGEDFRWPTSDGFPTRLFCKNVYLTPENKLEGEEWIYAFPSLKAELAAFRRKKMTIEPSKEKPENEDDWAHQAKQEVWKAHHEDRILNKVDPEINVENVEVLTRAKWRPPKNFVKYRPRSTEDMKKKEQKLNDYLEELEEVHHSVLPLIFPYGSVWLTRQMMQKKEWYPTANGFWTRDQMKAAKHMTAVWGFEERRTFGEAVDKESTEQSSVPQQPDIMAVGVYPAKIMDLFEGKIELAPSSMDDVSFVSATFVNSGFTLDTTTRVISQAPSRVEAEVKIRGSGRVIGRAVEMSAKEAKRKLMAALRRVLVSKKDAEVKVERNHKEEGAVPKGPPTPAPRRTVTVGGGGFKTHTFVEEPTPKIDPIEETLRREEERLKMLESKVEREFKTLLSNYLKKYGVRMVKGEFDKMVVEDDDLPFLEGAVEEVSKMENPNVTCSLFYALLVTKKNFGVYRR